MSIEEIKETRPIQIKPAEVKTEEYIVGYKCSDGYEFQTKEEAEKHEKNYENFKKYFVNGVSYIDTENIYNLIERYKHPTDYLEDSFWANIKSFEALNALNFYTKHEFKPERVKEGWYFFICTSDDFSRGVHWVVYSKQEILDDLELLKKEIPKD